MRRAQLKADFRHRRVPANQSAFCQKDCTLPFSVVVPNAVSSRICGVCREQNTLRKYIDCKSLDSGFAPIWMCTNCAALYNATAENEALDVLEWQKRWADDEEFYAVPDGEEFDKIVSQANGIFDFLQADLGVKLSGKYLEIGAGSGMTGASALNYFDEVHVFDHVQTRLNLVRDRVGERYHVSSFEDIQNIEADTVLIWHAMEHFLAPGAVFEMCAKRMNANAFLFIQVPVLSYEHVYPGHYYFYCEKAFEVLAKQNNLELIRFYYDHDMNAMTVSMRKPV
jgi:hypothetical protein